MDSPSTSNSSRNRRGCAVGRNEKGPAVLPKAGQKERRLKQRRETEQNVLLKVSSNGWPDYIRVLPSVRDRQLKLLITEKPDWRNGEQLSRN